MPIVTISRGSMSGGRELAERVATELDIPCIGREIVVEAAAALGVSRELLSEKLWPAPGAVGAQPALVARSGLLPDRS